MPNLIEIQKNSYEWFLKQGLKEVFDDVSGITVSTTILFSILWIISLTTSPITACLNVRERDATYAAALRVTARLLNKETGEIKESEVFMGDFPLMTPSGTFVINGAERVIVSQLVRSPGVYFKMEYDRSGKELFSSTIIPNRGAWLEYENDVNDVFYVRIDKTVRFRLRFLSADWVWAPILRFSTSSVTMIGCAQPSKRIPVKRWKKRSSKFTGSCVPVNRLLSKAPNPTLTACF